MNKNTVKSNEATQYRCIWPQKKESCTATPVEDDGMSVSVSLQKLGSSEIFLAVGPEAAGPVIIA